uniref:RING-type E3 ubiquitin transferase n=1 Tax=Steinernema glaseri TaxID=37863 RepID=A0A1I7XX48_9BILA
MSFMADQMLCPFYDVGSCDRGSNCVFVHGDVCDMCHKACLNPNSPQQRKEHNLKCVAEHEKAMEETFAIGNAIDKTCGICMDNVREKNRRFGILQNCRHCFCLECIMKWRQSEDVELETIRSCPECRIHSDFVIPASIWVDEGPEKEKLIEEYQENMAKKRCKYFKPNNPDSCKFGNKCFYRHENADGTIAKCDSPTEISRRYQNRPGW